MLGAAAQVVQKLTAAGHQAVPAALSTGLDLITGKGMDEALEGAEVVVNVANSPPRTSAGSARVDNSGNIPSKAAPRATSTPVTRAGRGTGSAIVMTGRSL